MIMWAFWSKSDQFTVRLVSFTTLFFFLLLIVNTVHILSSLYVCMAIKHIIVLFVETPRKFTWCFHKQNYCT